jgi:hypothetical protein
MGFSSGGLFLILLEKSRGLWYFGVLVNVLKQGDAGGY